MQSKLSISIDKIDSLHEENEPANLLLSSPTLWQKTGYKPMSKFPNNTPISPLPLCRKLTPFLKEPKGKESLVMKTKALYNELDHIDAQIQQLQRNLDNNNTNNLYKKKKNLIKYYHQMN